MRNYHSKLTCKMMFELEAKLSFEIMFELEAKISKFKTIIIFEVDAKIRLRFTLSLM